MSKIKPTNGPNLVTRDPFDPFRLMTEMLERSTFDPWLRPRSAAAELMPRGMLAPAFDVKERDDAYVIEADLPGMSDDDIDITLNHNRLTISGRREQTREESDDRMHTIERQFGSFSRSFTLPEEADAENIHGELEDGVLSVVIPKSEKSKPKKINLKQRVKRALRS